MYLGNYDEGLGDLTKKQSKQLAKAEKQVAKLEPKATVEGAKKKVVKKYEKALATIARLTATPTPQNTPTGQTTSNGETVVGVNPDILLSQSGGAMTSVPFFGSGGGSGGYTYTPPETVSEVVQTGVQEVGGLSSSTGYLVLGGVALLLLMGKRS